MYIVKERCLSEGETIRVGGKIRAQRPFGCYQ
jgi:hypothetical protein